MAGKCKIAANTCAWKKLLRNKKDFNGKTQYTKLEHEMEDGSNGRFLKLHHLLERFTADGPSGCACVLSGGGKRCFAILSVLRTGVRRSDRGGYDLSDQFHEQGHTCTPAMMLFEAGRFF
jgi:cob(I)alamin adenosyltransferase